LGITLLYLPSPSPNPNPIKRVWKFIKRRALYSRYHPTFAQFQAAIQEVLFGLSTTHAEKVKSLMTLKFPRLADVSLMAA
jgi:transposase